MEICGLLKHQFLFPYGTVQTGDFDTYYLNISEVVKNISEIEGGKIGHFDFVVLE